MTPEQRAILADIVPCPDRWMVRNIQEFGPVMAEWNLKEKCEKHAPVYEERKRTMGAGYKTRAEREPEALAALVNQERERARKDAWNALSDEERQVKTAAILADRQQGEVA